MKVLVLGAGVVGTSTAYYLARGGADVTLLDRHPSVEPAKSRIGWSKEQLAADELAWARRVIAAEAAANGAAVQLDGRMVDLLRARRVRASGEPR